MHMTKLNIYNFVNKLSCTVTALSAALPVITDAGFFVEIFLTEWA